MRGLSISFFWWSVGRSKEVLVGVVAMVYVAVGKKQVLDGSLKKGGAVCSGRTGDVI